MNVTEKCSCGAEITVSDTQSISVGHRLNEWRAQHHHSLPIQTNDDQARATAEWLCQTGYGYNFASQDDPLPDHLRLPLAKAWQQRDMRLTGSSDPIERYLEGLQDEGCW